MGTSFMNFYNKHGKRVTYQYLIAQLRKFLLLNKKWVLLLVTTVIITLMFIKNDLMMMHIHGYSYLSPHDSKYNWTQFGAYPALPYFHIKKGNKVKSRSNSILLSVATFCDLKLLDNAAEIASNYQSGPISIAIYIDQNYATHSDQSAIELHKLFTYTFKDINHPFDITIGLLYFDKSSRFYQKKGFDSSTPMMFKFPNNPLRNLAEHQITTKWLINIDIDFIYLSDTFSSPKVETTLKQLNHIISKPEIGNKTIFIIPSFEVIREDVDNIDVSTRYQSLNKQELVGFIKNEYLQEIAPFHAWMQAQKCTNYPKWYTMDKNEFSYKIPYWHYNYQNNCTWQYEPWYIINTEVSIMEEYQFDNQFVGRGLNKVERVFALRHFCFNFYVLNDLFIIHKPKSLHLDGIENHQNITSEDTEKWHENNKRLMDKKRKKYYRDPQSCSYNARTDPWCKTGIRPHKTWYEKIWGYQHCRFCCPIKCDQFCKSYDCDSILAKQIYCNETTPPCMSSLAHDCPPN